MTQRPPRLSTLSPLAGALVLSLLLGACADGERAPAGNTPDATAPAVDANATQPAPADITATPEATGAAALVGSRMPPYPDGLAEIVGSCVPGGEGLERVCDYGLAVLGRGDRDAGTATWVYLVGSRSTDPAADTPVWEITDALDVPVKEGYQLQMADCRIDGQPARSVTALVRHANGQEYSADIAWARHYDTASGKFMEIGGAKVDCVDPGAGV